MLSHNSERGIPPCFYSWSALFEGVVRLETGANECAQFHTDWDVKQMCLDSGAYIFSLTPVNVHLNLHTGSL